MEYIIPINTFGRKEAAKDKSGLFYYRANLPHDGANVGEAC
jgi:hypothetical protein